jgi:hypothetical protein
MSYYSYFQKMEMIISSKNLLSTNLQNLRAQLNIHLHDKFLSHIFEITGRGGRGGDVYYSNHGSGW